MRKFDDLYAAKAGYVYGLCYRLEGEGSKAEQLFAEVWKRVYESIEPSDPVSDESVLLCRHLAESHRRLGRTTWEESAGPEQALAGLASEYRLPLVLREVGGLGYEAIALALDIPMATVRARLARARTLLRSRREGSA